MTEQLGEPTEPIQNIVAERFGAEKQARESVACVMGLGRLLSQKEFESLADARQNVAEYIKQFHQEMGKVPNIQSVLMQASGGDVSVANPHYTIDSTSGAITIQFNNDPPVVSPPLLSSRLFRLSGPFVPYHQRDDGSVVVKPTLVGDDLERKSWGINPVSGLPMTTVHMTSKIMIPCDSDDAHIEIIELENEEKRIRAVEELAAYVSEETGLVDDVNEMNQALYKSDTERMRHKNLPDIDLLRSLGRKGIEYIQQGSKAADALNTAIAATIGKRPLMIDGKAYETNGGGALTESHVAGYEGRVMDVVSEIPMSDEYIGPTLAMTSRSAKDPNRISYLPLTDVTALQF